MSIWTYIDPRSTFPVALSTPARGSPGEREDLRVHRVTEQLRARTRIGETFSATQQAALAGLGAPRSGAITRLAATSAIDGGVVRTPGLASFARRCRRAAARRHPSRNSIRFPAMRTTRKLWACLLALSLPACEPADSVAEDLEVAVTEGTIGDGETALFCAAIGEGPGQGDAICMARYVACQNGYYQPTIADPCPMPGLGAVCMCSYFQFDEDGDPVECYEAYRACLDYLHIDDIVPP
jgi:hypothetical protein